MATAILKLAALSIEEECGEWLVRMQTSLRKHHGPRKEDCLIAVADGSPSHDRCKSTRKTSIQSKMIILSFNLNIF